MIKILSIKVTGHVHGVGFRYHTRNKAEEMGIRGFVRNELDGSVYIEAEGEESSMDEFVDWCRIGPKWARVDCIELKRIDARNYPGFTVK
jgi:acylphosphatase